MPTLQNLRSSGACRVSCAPKDIILIPARIEHIVTGLSLFIRFISVASSNYYNPLPIIFPTCLGTPILILLYAQSGSLFFFSFFFCC